ncbi:MAG: hypothetical protein IPJ34_08660 [Myxococcales bacterium]|nr:hypothetical protein [Myxococcales bacterium]
MEKLRRILVPAFALSFVGVAFVACSSDPDPVTEDTGTGTDAVAEVADAKPETETKPPFEVGLCDKPLAATFKCEAPIKLAGQTTCGEDDVQGFLKACWTPLGGSKDLCTAWQTAHATCNKCIAAWSYTSNGNPNRDACYYRVMTTTCANAVKCYFDCVTQACADCSDSTENLDCQKRARAAGGACYENSYKQADTEKCFDGKGPIDPCVVDELSKGSSADKALLADQLSIFYRGACRDNGDWSKASTGGDAGTDATSDAVSDAASDGATDAAADGG